MSAASPQMFSRILIHTEKRPRDGSAPDTGSRCPRGSRLSAGIPRSVGSPAQIRTRTSRWPDGSKPANGTGQMSFWGKHPHTRMKSREITFRNLTIMTSYFFSTWASIYIFFCIPYFYFPYILISDLKRKKYGIKKYIYIRSPQISFFCIPYFFSLVLLFKIFREKNMEYK